MQFLSSHPTPAGNQSEDDIDKVFKQLLPVEPSSELISRILAHIRHVVRPMPTASEPPDFEGLDSLVIRNERRDPS
jgi:hypothetical protein